MSWLVQAAEEKSPIIILARCSYIIPVELTVPGRMKHSVVFLRI